MLSVAGTRQPQKSSAIFASIGEICGLRIIYYYLMSDHQVWFVTIYNKDEMIDLSAEEKRILKRMIQAELVARRKT